MHLSAIDQVYWIASLLGEAALTAALLYRRQYREFPFFLAYTVFAIAVNVPSIWASSYGSASAYRQVYTVDTALEYTLELGVLIEIARRVLQPQRGTIPRKLAISLLCGLTFVFATIAFWALNQAGHSDTFTVMSAKLLQINFVFAYLRLTVFALIVGFSQMLGITWRNHVVRLASGLAFYSAVLLVVQLTTSHLSSSNHEAYLKDFRLLDRMQVIAYLITLAFWVWSFVQKDVARKEFTPQMERFLVTISQTARRNRVGFSRNLGHK